MNAGTTVSVAAGSDPNHNAEIAEAIARVGHRGAGNEISMKDRALLKP